MNWLQRKYIGLLSNVLRNFKRKSGDLYNFSCPICGDSHVDKRKARAYIYNKNSKCLFHCHNCNATYIFDNFLKKIDERLYGEYLLEKLKDEKSPEQKDLEQFTSKLQKPSYMKKEPIKALKKVSQLNANDPVKQLVLKRKIPNQYHAKLFKVSRFFEWVNTYIPNKFDEEALLYDETRLVIPFLNNKDEMFAFQGRSLDPKSKSKYITIILDERYPKLYGLDTVNVSKKIYVFEGPIDSMFIPNSIASAGGDLISNLSKFNKSNIVIVYDNEPRNPDTIKKLEKSMLNGYNVCVWPENLEHKDINDMAISGMSPEFIQYIIDSNTYRELSAMAAINKWKKL